MLRQIKLQCVHVFIPSGNTGCERTSRRMALRMPNRARSINLKTSRIVEAATRLDGLFAALAVKLSLRPNRPGGSAGPPKLFIRFVRDGIMTGLSDGDSIDLDLVSSPWRQPAQPDAFRALLGGSLRSAEPTAK